jgi:transcriptional regulator of arginine metabolism
MKILRQQLITEIVKTGSITTQEAIITQLRERGFTVNQPTLSRDLAEMGIKKHRTKSGYVYTCKTVNSTPRPSFSHGIKSINTAGNIVVIKCETGTAGAVCVSVEKLNISEIIGTIAGDDTIFAAAATAESAAKITNTLREITGIIND